MDAKKLIESVIDDNMLPADIIRDMCYDDQWRNHIIKCRGGVITEDTGGDVCLPDNPVDDPEATDNPESDSMLDSGSTITILLDSPEDESDYRQLIAALKAASVDFDLSNADDGLELSWPEDDQETLENILLGLGYETDGDDSTPEDYDLEYRQ